MIKKLSLIFALIAVILLAMSPSIAGAQAPTPTPVPSTTPEPQYPTLTGPDIYSFSTLGYTDQVLNGPYAYSSLRFYMPSNWKLARGTTVQLHLKTAFSSTSGISESELIQRTGARLDITFNGHWVTSLLLDWSGDRAITIPLPESALSRAAENVPGQQQSLSLTLNAGIDCKFNHHTSVVVVGDSVLDLKHDLAPTIVDLTQLPMPFYMINSLLPNEMVTSPDATFAMPNSVGLVLPDQPTAAELQAALTISAGLGRLSGGKIALNTFQVSQLADSVKNNMNLIFVTNGEGIELLKDSALPAPFDGSTFAAPGIAADDGLLQEVVSPWNPAKVVLLVSGQSEAGLVKAAQAVSFGVVQTAGRPDLAIVSAVNPPLVAETVPEDRTLASLGYETVQLNSSRYSASSSVQYNFFMPSGSKPGSDSYFGISYSPSAVINLEQSGLSVALNGSVIGGISYTKESVQTLTRTNVTIPAEMLKPGMNTLTISASNVPYNYCSDVDLSNLWTVISDQSVIHIPVAKDQKTEALAPTLANFMGFFTSAQTLDNIGFVIAPGSFAAVEAASKFAYVLGTETTGSLVELKSAFDGQLPEGFREKYNLVLVGKASELPTLGDLSANLPAPFDKGSNVAQETAMRVVYRAPENVSMGYLEILSAPWDATKTILTILGTSDEGISFSANAVTVAEIQRKLAGNFAAVRNEQVVTGDTRIGIGTGNVTATLVPEVTQVAAEATLQVPLGSQNQPVPLANQTSWIMPTVGVSSLLIVVILIVVLVTSRKGR